ncbi:glycosyltransferase family 4 protein [Sphingomonas sp. LHG3406-1]|uniref:glycosyltransferase family 4 protein n=1 Tax=Sphingomonas sp. LHG3406-1 TaxID=2804617 RepID=UPI00260CFB4D|nr:glycosyltransferase family 4 protein [Sphingomonas sp. LHG3406-1]
MKRRRLLLSTDAVGGVWTYSIDLARSLAAAEDMVVLLAVLGPSPSSDQLTEAAAVPGLQIIDTGLPLDWTAASERDVREAGHVLAHLAEMGQADLVQLHTPALASVCYPVPAISVVHSCVATWWEAVHGGEALPDDLAWRSNLVREGLGRSDVSVAPSESFARAVQKAYRLPEPPLTVANGRLANVGHTARQPFDVALTAGRLWDAGKNVAAFDRAAALSGIPFLAAGPSEGPDGSRLCLSHARAVGNLPAADLGELLLKRPLFVSVALYEPFGLAVLEAAQAGCALVLADCPVFHELWEGAALFVDPLDEHAIAAAVDRLVALPEERARLGDAARLRAARFTPDRTAEAMLGLYRQLLAEPQQERVAA